MDIRLPHSAKPQLLRATHEWCLEQGFVPYLLVQVDGAVSVPKEFVQDGQIVLNVGYDATSGLVMTNEAVSFKARFGGIPRDIYVPVDNIVALFSRETGQGMYFDPPSETAIDASPSTTPSQELPVSDARESTTSPSDTPPTKPFLTRIK